MCGIVGYTGPREAYPIVITGLKRLEYRGYDSTGVALMDGNKLNVYKKKGRVAGLEEAILGQNLHAHAGIGHTRWATHGEPSDRNAHPHRSASGKLAMIHNGIIENYAQIKKDLVNKGYTFSSETDTEVLLNFIEDIKKNNECNLEEAVRIALKRVTGAYCILLLNEEDPETIIAARKGSPLVIGVGKGEHFLGSDASPMLEYTKEVVYVNDYELAIVRPDELILKNLGNEKITPFVTKLDMELAAIEKGGYDHFMLKEIFEQPSTIHDCLRGRLDATAGIITMKGVEDNIEALKNANRIIIIACGTSWHAGLVAEYVIEELCRIPVEVEYASEFRYRNPIVNKGDVIIAISQSGETADTLVAIGAGPGQLISNLFPNPDLSVIGPYGLCGKCHDLGNQIVKNTSWSQHNRHISDGFSCSTCHTAHGMGAASGAISGERLVNFDLNVVATNGSVLSYNHAANSCVLVCHQEAHNPDGTVTPASSRRGPVVRK